MTSRTPAETRRSVGRMYRPSTPDPFRGIRGPINVASVPLFMAASGLDEEVPGHLEMERRAELGAVVGVGTGPVGDELEGVRLPRLEAQVDVVPRQREPVRRVLRPLQARQPPRHAVPALELDALRGEVAADRRHVDGDLVPV